MVNRVKEPMSGEASTCTHKSTSKVVVANKMVCFLHVPKQEETHRNMLHDHSPVCLYSILYDTGRNTDKSRAGRGVNVQHTADIPTFPGYR